MPQELHDGDDRTPSSRASASLTSEPGKEYTGGLNDEDLQRLATEAGREGLHNRTIWGHNAEEHHLEEALRAWHDVNAGLIAHRAIVDVDVINEQLDELEPGIEQQEQAAVEAVEDHGDLELQQEALQLRVAREELEPPEDGRDWGHGLKLGALVVADIGLLTVANQVLGLSDERFLGIPFTSETALTAIGTVLALVLLAHFAGQQIATGLHHLRTSDTTSKESS